MDPDRRARAKHVAALYAQALARRADGGWEPGATHPLARAQSSSDGRYGPHGWGAAIPFPNSVRLTAAEREAERIMLAVHRVSPEYHDALLRWAGGQSAEDQATELGRAKGTIDRWMEGGIAAVITLQLHRRALDAGHRKT